MSMPWMVKPGQDLRRAFLVGDQLPYGGVVAPERDPLSALREAAIAAADAFTTAAARHLA
ncbi:hypothetical protein [Streptomyces sp. NPDC126499]|uniref:hypothetical protein n=1 Tax=Streptomyces sp. NPDC126499 TaxID=3155314 RepID=UPI0033200D1B